MDKITVIIGFYDDLLNKDLETLVRKGLDTEENICRAFIKNIRIS